MQCCVTLFIKKDVIVCLSGVIGRVLAQEVENGGSIVGPVDEVNDGDLARVGQRCTEVRKLLSGNPGIKPRAVGFEIDRSVD